MSPSQKILDRAAQRSRHLGISDTSKFPITDFPATPQQENTTTSTVSSKSSSGASPKDPKNVVRFSSKKKTPLQEDNHQQQQQFDNISVEINITTDSNVGVSDERVREKEQ